MNKKILILSAFIVLITLAMAVPAIADPVTYSVSVSPYGGSISPSLSPSKLLVLNDYGLQKPSFISSSTSVPLSIGKISAMTGSPTKQFASAMGSASAFVSFKGMQGLKNTSYMEVSQKTSMIGNISMFNFEVSYY